MNAANSLTCIVLKWFACTCLMGFKTMNRFPGEDLSVDVLLPPTYFMGESNWMLLERRDFLAEFAASRASRLLPCTELQLFRSGHQCNIFLFHNGRCPTKYGIHTICILYHLEYLVGRLSDQL